MNKNGLVGFKHILILIYEGTGCDTHFHWVECVFCHDGGSQDFYKAKSYELDTATAGWVDLHFECCYLWRQKDGAFEITLKLWRGPENIKPSCEWSLETWIQTHSQHSQSCWERLFIYFSMPLRATIHLLLIYEHIHTRHQVISCWSEMLPWPHTLPTGNPPPRQFPSALQQHSPGVRNWETPASDKGESFMNHQTTLLRWEKHILCSSTWN